MNKDTAMKFDTTQLPHPDKRGFFAHPDITEGTPIDEIAIMAGAVGYECVSVAFDHGADPVSPGDDWICIAKYDVKPSPVAVFVLPPAASPF